MPLAAMHPVEIKSRDGLTLVSYLTLPPGSDPDGDGTRRPAACRWCCWSTAGRGRRDAYGYNACHQWLANRGYAVLSVNFRASTGFGKKFISAGDLQWGRKMHDDLLDAVDWAVKRRRHHRRQGRDHGRQLRRLCDARRPDLHARHASPAASTSSARRTSRPCSRRSRPIGKRARCNSTSAWAIPTRRRAWRCSRSARRSTRPTRSSGRC